MTSYPRSGNTLLRAYLEKILGLASGSDSDISKKLNVEDAFKKHYGFPSLLAVQNAWSAGF